MSESAELAAEAHDWEKRADNRHGIMSPEVAATNAATAHLLHSMARLMAAIERLEAADEARAFGDEPR